MVDCFPYRGRQPFAIYLILGRLGPDGEVFAPVAVRQEPWQQVVDRVLVPALSGAQDVDRLVDRDAMQPRRWLRVALELIARLVGSDEGLLHCLARVVDILEHASRDREQPRHVPPDELLEGLRIAGT